ncbi:uncharacterized protein LOC103845048 [Brassica rapa]|uniref:Uncharacterized protein n=1 Tax=Brassica campestris TaxID=3711 RepID=M4CF64_BRACM|nr:uncharacterized protein LOC103845048 [Brassica rapa]
MAGTKDSHIVEIPVDEEHKEKQQQQQQQLVTVPTPGILKVIQQHPLSEISESPGHLLLLKLWQREEDLFCRRVLRKESRLESIKREIFQLCCFFLIFHGFFFTILYSSSCPGDDDDVTNAVCKKWWIPSALSLATSLVLVFLVQAKLFLFWKVSRGVHRERNDNRTLTRCVLELRMKGSSFDLSKEPMSGKRMKSSSVEIKWKPVTWFSQYLITILLLCFAGLFFPVSKFILCGF